MHEHKKKILFAAYSLDVGGIETALLSLINHLVEEYEITLVLENKKGVFLNQIDKRVKIIEYKPSYLKFKLFAKLINLYKRLRFYIIYNKKFDFSCSYATYCKMASVVARIASSNNALWVHNNYYKFFNDDLTKYKNFFDNICAHKFRNVLFVSEESKKQYVEKYGIKNEKVITCNNLINYEKILELSNEKIDMKKESTITTFINISRHDEHQKRISRLLECAKMLDLDNEKFRILLVGTGPETEMYKRLVEEHNLKDKVIFIGKKVNPYPYLKISDCVMLTSDYEGYPVTYVEAETFNKPIITTDVSDSDVDIQDRYGVVTKKDTKSIYYAMKDFIENGFYIKDRFNPQEYNQQIIKKIEDIINERN